MTTDVTAERTARPAQDEYAPFYGRYVAHVPAGDIVRLLESELDTTVKFFRAIPSDRTTAGYAPGKWNIREIVGHLCDTERIMTYRALRFARGDRTPVPGFEENDYVPTSGASVRTMEELLAELRAVRGATVALFDGLPAGAWRRRGVANGAEVSVRALAAIVVGHVLHHQGVVRERYLGPS